ncbi:MAG: AsmA family protein, partial [Alphaproteobacteria bacterium]
MGDGVIKIGRIIGVVVAIFVVIIGAGAGYLVGLDVDEYRLDIAQAAKDATGRALKLEGPLSLSVSLTPTISGEGISFANAPWGSQPHMLTLRRFEVQLSLLPLLFGDIQIQRLVLVEPEIFLETNKAGAANWQFEAMASKSGEKADARGQSSGGDATLPHIGQLLIEKGHLTFLYGATGTVTKLALTQIEADAASADDPLNLKLQAAFNDMPVKLRGSVGPLKNALSPHDPVQADLTVEGLGLSIGIKGSGKATDGTIDAIITISAANLSGLRPLAGDALPDNLSLKFSAHAKATGGNASLSDLRLNLGRSDLSGSINIDATGALPKITAEIKGRRLDLAELLPGDGDKTGDKGKSGRPGKVLPADPLPLDSLRLAEADIKIAIAEVATPQLVLNELSAVIQLANGHLTVKPMTVTAAGSPISISAAINAVAKVPTVAFHMAASKLDLGRLLAETRATELLQGSGNLKVTLAGRGASVTAIAGSLNGGTNLLMTEGRVKTEALDLAMGGLSALVGMMSSGEKSEWTVLNCVASRFDMKKGVATSRVLLADTEYSTVVGEGSLDLGKETLAMKVSPQSKSTTLKLAVPIKIGGTFAQPTFRPDELATARRLGGLFGAAL